MRCSLYGAAIVRRPLPRTKFRPERLGLSAQAIQSRRSRREVDDRPERDNALRFGGRATKGVLEDGAARGRAASSCVEHGRAARSAGLGAVERSVGETHQFVRLGGGRGKERKATGAGQTNAERRSVERRREYRLDFLSQGVRLVARADSIAEDGEFIAADPRGRAAPIHSLGEPGGDLPQN